MRPIPLNALRAFEAAARHMSFQRAAAELHVTPGSVSHHIQQIEAHVCAPLFERKHRGVRLTAVGDEYFLAVTEAFKRLEVATQKVVRSQRKRRLHIWSSVTFTMRWLLPRLPSFHEAYPDLDVMFTTSLKPLDFADDNIDIAIRVAKGPTTGVVTHVIVETDLLPVCSPRLLKGTVPLAKVDDLAHHTLLRSVQRDDDWGKWLHFVGLPDINPRRGMSFETSSLAYQAAIEGMGVAMAQKVLVGDDLAAGRLVAPFNRVLRDDGPFCLLYPKSKVNEPHLIAFRDWLLAQAKGAPARSEPGGHDRVRCFSELAT